MLLRRGAGLRRAPHRLIVDALRLRQRPEDVSKGPIRVGQDGFQCGPEFLIEEVLGIRVAATEGADRFGQRLCLGFVPQQEHLSFGLPAGKQGRGGPHSGVRKRYLFCCPAKLPGFVAGISRWIYARDARSVYVNLYVSGSATIDLPDCPVGLTQKTSLPWKGLVTITVEPNHPGTFDLCLRIPGWAQGRPFPSDLYRFDDASGVDWIVKINGERMDATQLDKGYVRISRLWKSGDRVELRLPMPARRVYACENVEHDRGRVALMRGPIIYCLEGVDHDFSVLSMVLPKKAKIDAEHQEDLLNGVTVLKGRGLTEGDRPVEFVAVPYYAWQNRGIDEMTVWIVEDPDVLSSTQSNNAPVKEPNISSGTGT